MEELDEEKVVYSRSNNLFYSTFRRQSSKNTITELSESMSVKEPTQKSSFSRSPQIDLDFDRNDFILFLEKNLKEFLNKGMSRNG